MERHRNVCGTDTHIKSGPPTRSSKGWNGWNGLERLKPPATCKRKLEADVNTPNAGSRKRRL
jgi:hypothetical protein